MLFSLLVSFFFPFVCVLLFVAVVVVVVVVTSFLHVVCKKQGRALVPSVIPAPLCDDFFFPAETDTW